MEAFVVGLVIGVAFGVIIVGFLAGGAYDRGFKEALHRKKAWRAGLVPRHAGAARARPPRRADSRRRERPAGSCGGPRKRPRYVALESRAEARLSRSYGPK